MRVLAAACGAADGGGPYAGDECVKAHAQLGAADLPTLGPNPPSLPCPDGEGRTSRRALTPHLTPRLDTAP